MAYSIYPQTLTLWVAVKRRIRCNIQHRKWYKTPKERMVHRDSERWWLAPTLNSVVAGKKMHDQRYWYLCSYLVFLLVFSDSLRLFIVLFRILYYYSFRIVFIFSMAGSMILLNIAPIFLYDPIAVSVISQWSFALLLIHRAIWISWQLRDNPSSQ